MDSGVYSSLDYMPYYRGAIWSAAIVWTLVSSDRLVFYSTKHSESKFFCALPTNLVNMSNRKQKVQWNSSVSKVLPNNFGVPQGSTLAPLLFIILTGDLASEVLTGTDTKSKSAVIQYADDTTGLCASKSWEVTQANLSTMGKSLESYSTRRSIRNPSFSVHCLLILST